jgi:hypothetical protein
MSGERGSVAELGLISRAFVSSNPVTLGLLVAGRRRRLLTGEADDVAAFVAVVDVAVRLNDVGEVVGEVADRAVLAGFRELDLPDSP